MRTVALIACVVACDASEKHPAPGPAPPKLVVTRRDVPDLQYLPADADIVIKLDVVALRKAALWQTYGRELGGWLLPGLASCGYDAMADARTMMIAARLDPPRSTIVVRGLDRAKLIACTQRAASDAPAMVALSDVLVTQTGARTETLAASLQSAAHLDQRGDAFGTVYEATAKQLKPGAAITVITRPALAPLVKVGTQTGTSPQSVYASADVTDRLDARISVVLGSLPEATNVATFVQSRRQAPEIKQRFDRFDALAQGSTLHVYIGMTAAQVADIAGLLPAAWSPNVEVTLDQLLQ